MITIKEVKHMKPFELFKALSQTETEDEFFEILRANRVSEEDALYIGDDN